MQFSFNEFVVDESLLTIKRNCQLISIEPKVFDLLLYFCKHPNQPISRDTLIENVWGNRIVSYAAINRAVSELRKILEPEESSTKILKTISKVGYQLEAEITLEVGESVPARMPNVAVNNKWKTRLLLHSVILTCVVFIGIYLVTKILDSTPTKQISSQNFFELPVTTVKGSAFKPHTSNNEAILAYIYRETSGASASIWIKEKGNTPRKITNDTYYYTFAIFSDDYEVMATRLNNLEERKCEIVSIDIKSQKIEKIVDCGIRATPILAFDDEKKLLFYNDREAINSPYFIYSFNTSTKRKKQLTFPYSDGNIRGDYNLAISENGQTLAILEYQNDTTARIKILDLDSDELRTLQQSFPVNTSISWNGNDDIIISDGKGLASYSVMANEVRRMILNSDIGYVHVNPKSKNIYFDKGNQVVNIYQHSLAEKNLVAKTSSRKINYKPAISNRGDKSIFLSVINQGLKINLLIEDGTVVNTNFPEKINHVTNYDWSVNDENIVASINGEAFLLNLSTLKWKKISSNDQDIHYVNFGFGNSILYSSDSSGDWQIWKLDIDSGIRNRISDLGGYSVQQKSEDSILISKYAEPGLYELNIETLVENRILWDFKITSWKKWHLVDGGIFHIRGNELVKFNPDTNTSTSILTFEGRVPSSFSLSSDQQQIQYEIIEESNSNIWMLSEENASH